MDSLIENSTVHGVTHAYKTNNKIIKMFWMSLIILGIAGIVANMGYVVAKYLTYPVAVSLTFEKTFQWPELTFCNPTAPFLVKENSSRHIYWKEIVNMTFYKIRHTKDFNTYSSWQSMMVMATIDMRRFEFSFRHSLMRVTFVRNNGQSFKHASVSELFKLFIIRNKTVLFGYNIPCYSMKLRDTSLEDHRTIDHVIFSFRLDSDSNKIFNNNFYPRSLYLSIDNVDEIPQKKHYIITSGYVYHIDISQTRYIHKESKGSCRTERFTTDIYDPYMINSSLYEGGFGDCVSFTSQKRILKHCTCYWSMFPIHRHGSEFPKLCLNASLFTAEQYLENIKCFEKHYNLSFKECEKYKLRKCDSKSYTVSIHKAELIEMRHLIGENENSHLSSLNAGLFPELVNKHSIPQSLRETFLQMIIKRENEFVDLRQEEYSYIFSQLFSDIGGLMGICLGISLVGVSEMGLLLYYFVKEKVKCQKISNIFHSVKEPVKLINNDMDTFYRPPHLVTIPII